MSCFKVANIILACSRNYQSLLNFRMLTRLSADPALQGKRRVKQCLPLKSSSNISNDVFQSTFFHCFPEMFSFKVILALNPSLLVIFYLRGESERGIWSPDYPRILPPGVGTRTRPPFNTLKSHSDKLSPQTSECLPEGTSNRRKIKEKSFETPSGHWLRKKR